jgi:S-adenosylmethionine:tRNA ribosyltransferase-isomerase
MPSAHSDLDDLAAYDYHLPSEAIAQAGAEPRDAARLLCLSRHAQPPFMPRHRVFRELGQELRPGDVLVMNQTRVIPARLLAYKPSGGQVEVLLLREHQPLVWSAYLKPARRVAVGSELHFGDHTTATVTAVLPDGARMLQFKADIKPFLGELGALPLPPYITSTDPALLHGERYQTVYAREAGSVAAPTAGLHFTPELLEHLQHQGVILATITLHVGAGTFKPVTDLSNHHMHSEVCMVPETTVNIVQAAKVQGRRVIAVGTTTVRTLESAWVDGPGGGELRELNGETSLFIRPGHQFNIVDGLITNFHLPKSTLLMLVAAFAGHANTMNAYAVAVQMGYRFYSLGDAMLIV